MNFRSKLASLALLSLTCFPALADTSYSISTSATDQRYWVNAGNFEIGRVSLAAGTADILALTTSVTLVDQGWGGEHPNNGVFVGLFEGDTERYQLHMAGANHGWHTDAYDLGAHAADFAGINAALDAVSWGSGVTVRFYTNAWDYPGWELHTRNDSLNLVTGAAAPAPVPEPQTYAMLAAGLGLLGASSLRRRSRQPGA
ncbi:MAG: PEP-CTERM sorting domain-containing protein [Gammaproteobacteria bacterium]